MNILKSLKNKKGFSLIELIVVMAIIGILAAIIVPNFSSFLDRGRKTQAVSDAAQLASNMNTLNLTGYSIPQMDGSEFDQDQRDDLFNTLRDKNLLPQLSIDNFKAVLDNVLFDDNTRFYKAKPRDSIGLEGY